MNTIFFFPNPAQGHFAFSTSLSPNTQDLICGFIPYLLPFLHSYLRPRHFTLIPFNGTSPFLSNSSMLGKFLWFPQNKTSRTFWSWPNQSNTMTSLDQESKATQLLKQPQKHFKCIGTSHNIIMPSRLPP